MKQVFVILKFEILQNKLQCFLIFLIALFLGCTSDLAFKAEHKISELTSLTIWNADLAIIPKGVSLIDLQKEIVNGVTTAFLPEALFQTTLKLSENKFNLTAILPLTENNQPIILTNGNFATIGLDWVDKNISIQNWKDQTQYSSGDWGKNVIAAFFASGPIDSMKKLKELIDKKTVAQAIVIKDQEEHDLELYHKLQGTLFVFYFILFSLTTISFSSLILWLRIRIKNSLQVFEELGLSKYNIQLVVLGLVLFNIFIPFSIGAVMASQLNFIF